MAGYLVQLHLTTGTDLNVHLWSSCSLTPLYSLTGPVGQLFASRLGGPSVRVLGMHPHFWNWDLLLMLSRYIGDLNVIPNHWPR
jgi:hypothetical protein